MLLVEIDITKMQQAALPAIVQLEQEFGLSSWGIAGYERELLNPQAILLVAHHQESGRLVGFLTAREGVEEVELLTLAVRSEFRKRGIGTALLVAGCREAQARGIRRWFLEVRAMNLPAIQLYEKLGFLVVGRRRNYYQSPVDDALIMQWED